jgi:hypothetical protein
MANPYMDECSSMKAGKMITNLLSYFRVAFQVNVYDTLPVPLRRCGHEMCQKGRSRENDSMKAISNAMTLVNVLDESDAGESVVLEFTLAGLTSIVSA